MEAQECFADGGRRRGARRRWPLLPRVGAPMAMMVYLNKDIPHGRHFMY